MKRFIMLALAAALILGLASMASAVELKVSGEFQVHGDWAKNVNSPGTGTQAGFQSAGQNPNGTHADLFEVQQRFRSYFNFVASENLKAVWGIEVGTNYWGQSGGGVNAVQAAGGSPAVIGNVGRSSGFGPDGDGVNIETKWAYLDFNIPGSTANVKVGLLPVTFPNAFGSSAITDMDAPAVVVSSPITDLFSVTAAWTRMVDNYTGSTTQTGSTGWDPTGTRNWDELDAFLLALPITPKGFTIVPWGAFAMAGKGLAEPTLNGASGVGLNATGTAVTGSTAPSSSNTLGLLAPLNSAKWAAGGASDQTTVWWAGLAFAMKAFDPFDVAFDFNYGSEKNSGIDLERKGWIADAKVSYKGLPFGTPTLFGMYSTGEDDNSSITLGPGAALGNGKSERMPFLLEDWNFPGGFWHGGSSFDSQNGKGADFGGLSNSIGTWTVGAGLYGISFLENLKHDLIFAYIRGTNDKDSIPMLRQLGLQAGTGLTTDDYIYEVDFNHSYQVYEQLAAIVELGYLIPHYENKAAWGVTGGTSNAYRILAGLKYKF